MSTAPESKSKMEAALDDLELAEHEVFCIMQIAEETLQELQNLPQCNTGKLIELSAKYMELIQSVHNRISAHSSTMKAIPNDLMQM